MEKATFIKINDNIRIKLSNIKDYRVCYFRREYGNYPEGVEIIDKNAIVIYQRKIWLTGSVTAKTAVPKWLKISEREYDRYKHKTSDEAFGLTSPPDIDSSFDTYMSNSELIETLGEELHALKLEYQEKSKKKGFFAQLLANDTTHISGEHLSSHVLEHEGESPPEHFLTKGRLLFNGRTARCEGSPFRMYESSYSESLKKSYYREARQSRILVDEKELLQSGELMRITRSDDKIRTERKYVSRILHDATRKERYLCIRTFQNDEFKFSESDCNIDEILNKLDDNLAI